MTYKYWIKLAYGELNLTYGCLDTLDVFTLLDILEARSTANTTMYNDLSYAIFVGTRQAQAEKVNKYQFPYKTQEELKADEKAVEQGNGYKVLKEEEFNKQQSELF